MLKYAKIINEKTKQCEVGLGTNIAFYKNIGMNKLDVEQGYDGWYIKGYAPQKPLEELKEEKIQELKNNCQNYIYSKYPIYKQLNAASGLATKEEISQMITFIQKARLICEEKEQQINSAKTQKELEKIPTNFNQE